MSAPEQPTLCAPIVSHTCAATRQIAAGGTASSSATMWYTCGAGLNRRTPSTLNDRSSQPSMPACFSGLSRGSGGQRDQTETRILQLPQPRRHIGVRRHRQHALAELVDVGLADRDTMDRAQHFQHALSQRKESGVGPGKGNDIGIEDELPKPLAQDLRVTE